MSNNWTPTKQRETNTEFERRMGAFEAELSEIREGLEQVKLLAAATARNIELLLEALTQQRG